MNRALDSGKSGPIWYRFRCQHFRVGPNAAENGAHQDAIQDRQFGDFRDRPRSVYGLIILRFERDRLCPGTPS